MAYWNLIDWKKNTGVCSNCNRLDQIDPLAKYCRYCGQEIHIPDIQEPFWSNENGWQECKYLSGSVCLGQKCTPKCDGLLCTRAMKTDKDASKER